MDQTRGRLPSRARLAVALVTIALLLTRVTGAAAASKERVGDRISLLDPPATYPADTAFHIWHGFVFQQGIDRGYGRYEFQLDVDGVARAADFTEVTMVEPTLVSKVWVFNFPDGLSGTHIFTGHWSRPMATRSSRSRSTSRPEPGGRTRPTCGSFLLLRDRDLSGFGAVQTA